MIELRSGSDRLQVLQDNMQEYIDNGTQLGWLIDRNILILLHKGIMVKDGWRHFTVDWDSLNWNRQKFLWKDLIENPNILWEKFHNETIQEIREYLVELASSYVSQKNKNRD
ncbi:hypothetical protein [Nostoc sp.]|uniref:hypothetical protein n=1 Tax=Nostoc sp. TaxID=1180 RepID=UPI002FF7260C